MAITKKTATTAAPAGVDFNIDEVLAAIGAALTATYGTSNSAAAPVARTKGKAVAAPVEEVDEDEVDEDVELEPLDEEETRAMGIKDLRALAVSRGLEEQKSKVGILAELEANGSFGEVEEADEDEEEDDDEEEEGEESDVKTEEELREMKLTELRAFLKESGIAYERGSDQDTLVELYLAAQGEAEEDDEEEEDDEAEEEEVEIDEDTINAMPLKELRELAADLELNLKVPAAAKTTAAKEKFFRTKILAAAE